MKHFLLIVCYCFIAKISIAQTTANGIIRGKVTHALTNEFLSGVSVSLDGSSLATKTDSLGGYTFINLKPGLYNIQFYFVGFKHKTAFEILVNNANATIVDVALEVEGKEISEVKVYASTFIKPVESPVSVQTIGSNEIKRNPGGNRDISKAIQSLPGVGSSTSFRNDLIVRGGAPK